MEASRVTLVKKGSILMFQTILAVSPIWKAVVDYYNYADCHNPITYIIGKLVSIAVMIIIIIIIVITIVMMIISF